MKRTVSAIMVLALVFCLAMPAFAANQTQIAVTSSKIEVEVGEEFDITVAFNGTPANNISVLELIVPVDTAAFEVVDSSVASALPTLSGITTGGAAYRVAKHDVFCNWVDVQSVIPTSTTTIFTFTLKATNYAKNGGHTFTISDECFLTDANDNDIFFDVTPCTITLTGSTEEEVPATAEPVQNTEANNNTATQATGTPADPVEKTNVAPWIIVGVIVAAAAAVVVVSNKKKK